MLIWLTRDELHPERRSPLGEQSRTRPASERIKKYMQLVHQSVREQRPDERAAAAHEDVASLGLQAPDRVGVIGPDDP